MSDQTTPPNPAGHDRPARWWGGFEWVNVNYRVSQVGKSISELLEELTRLREQSFHQSVVWCLDQGASAKLEKDIIGVMAEIVVAMNTALNIGILEQFRCLTPDCPEPTRTTPDDEPDEHD